MTRPPTPAASGFGGFRSSPGRTTSLPAQGRFGAPAFAAPSPPHPHPHPQQGNGAALAAAGSEAAARARGASLRQALHVVLFTPKRLAEARLAGLAEGLSLSLPLFFVVYIQ